MIVLYVFNFIINLLSTFFVYFIPILQTEIGLSEIYIDLARSIILAIIWIPYFSISERVKDTFVNRYKKKNIEINDIENMNLQEDQGPINS